MFYELHARLTEALVVGVVRDAVHLAFLGLDLKAQTGVLGDRAGVDGGGNAADDSAVVLAHCVEE